MTAQGHRCAIACGYQVKHYYFVRPEARPNSWAVNLSNVGFEDYLNAASSAAALHKYFAWRGVEAFPELVTVAFSENASHLLGDR